MTPGDTAELLMEAGAPAPVGPAAAPPARARRPVIRQYELVERVRAYDPDADEDLLNRAYVFAMKAHGAQLRASGDPYFHHPVEVAGILTGFKLDSASIATALLHDTVEDTGATLEEIERLFGRTVARLVDGVTKLNRLELQSAHTAQAENFRKLLLAMSEDIRVLLVKLADRLHNMRTLAFHQEPGKAPADRRRDHGDLRARWPSGSAWRRSRPNSRTWPSPSCGRTRARACCTGCAICGRATSNWSTGSSPS